MNRNIQDLKPSTILSCLALVEKYIPRKATMPEYSPSADYNISDILPIQKEAENMMKYVGLEDYHVKISIVRKPLGTAGSINLNHDKEVPIEIDQRIIGRPKGYYTILGVLAHEICHKLLFTHGLYLTDTSRNEICTDLATIYVGFGKLTLNGCYDRTKDFQFSTGYLTPQSYLLAFHIMLRSYGLNPDSEDFGFPDDYQYAVNFAENFKKYSVDEIKETFVKQSETLAKNRRNVVILQGLLDQLLCDMNEGYKQLDNRFRDLILPSGDTEEKPLSTFYAMTFAPEKVEFATKRINIDELIETLKFQLGVCRFS